MEIVKHTGDNIGGNYKLKIAYVEDIQLIPESVDGTIHLEVTMKPNTQWYDLYCTEGTINFKDVAQPSDHGDFYLKTDR